MAIRQSACQFVNQSVVSNAFMLTSIINIGFVCATKALRFQCVLIHVKLFHNGVIELEPLSLRIATIHTISVDKRTTKYARVC